MKKDMFRQALTLSAMLFLVTTVFFAGYFAGTREPAQAQGQQPTGTEDLFAPFWETWTLLHENYVDPLDDNALMEGAINGMMETLGDPHSGYISPIMFADINEKMSGAYEGIGAVVRQNEETGGLELVTIMDNSPAQRAGLMPGDQIIKVEGQDITELTQEEIIGLVRGPAGTPVRLGILRAASGEMEDVDVTRDRVVIPSVTYRILDNNIGYLRLSQFDFASSQEMRDALDAMDANNLDGLILDVRGNPGGYLTTAIEVASAFIPSGTIVSERGPGREQVYAALEDAIAPDVPMVVLVDQGSASASELIAGALQDHDRAIIIGMQTFGKGSVQTWRELSNGGGVRITISRWYTPNGTSVSEVGITPNYVIPYIPVEDDLEADNQLDAAITFFSDGPDAVEALVEQDADEAAAQTQAHEPTGQSTEPAPSATEPAPEATEPAPSE